MRTEAQQERIKQIRLGLKLVLGGRCALCGETDHTRLEIDHPTGCTWVQRKLNTGQRWRRYLAEYQQGVPLRLLCRSCNGAENQWTHGLREARQFNDGVRCGLNLADAKVVPNGD